jgi:hypothetical protein
MITVQNFRKNFDLPQITLCPLLACLVVLLAAQADLGDYDQDWKFQTRASTDRERDADKPPRSLSPPDSQTLTVAAMKSIGNDNVNDIHWELVKNR